MGSSISSNDSIFGNQDNVNAWITPQERAETLSRYMKLGAKKRACKAVLCFLACVKFKNIRNPTVVPSWGDYPPNHDIAKVIAQLVWNSRTNCEIWKY